MQDANTTIPSETMIVYTKDIEYKQLRKLKFERA